MVVAQHSSLAVDRWSTRVPCAGAPFHFVGNRVYVRAVLLLILKRTLDVVFCVALPGASNLSELHVVASTVLIRRLKKDVLSQLPSKSRQQVFVEIAKKSLKEIHELQQRRVALDGRIRSASGATEIALKNERRALTIKMYNMTGLSKVCARALESWLLTTKFSDFLWLAC